MIEKGVFQYISEKKGAQPSPALLAIPCSLGSHRITNRTHENVGKSPASILYRKNYKMSPQYLPPFSCICRPEWHATVYNKRFCEIAALTR